MERTRVDVFGEFLAPGIPSEQVEAVARKWLEEPYDQDAPALSAMQSSPKETF